MSKKTKQEKGITLIALVITIIVLLILAGIAIAMLTGENGILNKAKAAKERTIAGSENETVSLAYNDIVADKLEGTSTGDITVVEMEQALERQGVDSSEATVQGITGQDKIKITFTETGNEYEVNTKIRSGTTPTVTPVATPSSETEETSETITPSADYLGLKEGDKVIYTYNGTQIPCTVLYDADPSRSYASDNYGVQIIADDVVGNGVELGNGDGNSGVFIEDETALATAWDSFNDAIGILNRAAEGYINSDLALDARCVGSIPNNKNYKNTAKYSYDYDWFSPYNNQYEDGDQNYIADTTQMVRLDIPDNEDNLYWYASRHVWGYTGTSSFPGSTQQSAYVRFAVRYKGSYGSLSSSELISISNKGVYSRGSILGLRPVFILRPDVKVVIGANNKKVLTK